MNAVLFIIGMQGGGRAREDDIGLRRGRGTNAHSFCRKEPFSCSLTFLKDEKRVVDLVRLALAFEYSKKPLMQNQIKKSSTSPLLCTDLYVAPLHSLPV